MSATALAERLIKQAESGADFDWRWMRDEIVDEHGHAVTTTDRVLCLQLHKIVLDAAERKVSPEMLDTFRTARRHDYNCLLVSEALIGRTDDNVDWVKLSEITRREIAAGRMPPDGKLNELAMIGARFIGFIGSPPKQRARVLSRLFSGRWPQRLFNAKRIGRRRFADLKRLVESLTAAHSSSADSGEDERPSDRQSDERTLHDR